MMQDGKGLLPNNFPLQIMFKLLADSWCAERSFSTKTISSSLFGEYKYCQIILIRWIYILVIASCVKTFYVLQNQLFFLFVPPVCVFLVTATCSLLIFMFLRWLLNLLFVWFLCFGPPDMYELTFLILHISRVVTCL